MPRRQQVVTWTATLRFQFVGHRACRWCGSLNSIREPSLKFVGFLFRRYGWFSVTALSGLVTLTLTYKWGHESLVSWASFLSIFSPSILDLGSGTGQTDGRTDGRTDRDRRRPATLNAPPCGGGYNKQWLQCLGVTSYLGGYLRSNECTSG